MHLARRRRGFHLHNGGERVSKQLPVPKAGRFLANSEFITERPSSEKATAPLATKSPISASSSPSPPLVILPTG